MTSWTKFDNPFLKEMDTWKPSENMEVKAIKSGNLEVHQKTSSGPMDIDDVLETIKPLGWYQIVLAMIYLYAMFPLSVNNGFMAYDTAPKFICKDHPGNNESLIPSPDCHVYYNCSKSNLSFVVDYFSVSHQFGLICDQSYYVSLITSIQMAGELVGALIIGYISDTYGRKPTFIIIMAVQIIFGSLSSLSPTWPIFTVFRFLIGCCAGAEMVAGWVLMAECTTNRYRYLVRTLAAATIASLDQVLLAYLTKNWKWYAVAGNLQGIPLLVILIFFVYESPRWLLQKGRDVEAEAVLRKIAKFNRTSDRVPEKLNLQCGQGQTAKTRPWELFSTRQLSIYTIVSVLTWFLLSTIYYGMFFNTSYLPANLYVKFSLVGLFGMLEVPIAIYDAYNPKMNRKWTLLTAWVFVVICDVGVTLLLTLASEESFDSYNIVLAIVSVSGQLSVSVAFDIAYIYSVELFPTLLRSTAGSFCSIGARVGAVIAPQMLNMRLYWPAAPYVLFAGLAAVSLIIDTVFYPNTKNMHLPEAKASSGGH